MQLLQHTGEYFLLMGRVLRLPDRQRMFWRQYSRELEKQGLQSLPIVLLISVFIGAILTIQAKTNTENPLLPTYITGLLTRDTLLLEFSSTILCLILAGKVGSNIASEIGTMRITEQIDAMEIMGVNSANYLILPKILAFMSYFQMISRAMMAVSRMFIMIGALLLAFDCVGLFLAYQYVEFRPWQLAVFYISIAALTGDLAHNIYRYRGLRAEGADVSAILTESIDDLTSGWNILTLIAIGGKLILGVLLVLWTVFPLLIRLTRF